MIKDHENGDYVRTHLSRLYIKMSWIMRRRFVQNEKENISRYLHCDWGPIYSGPFLLPFSWQTGNGQADGTV